MFIALFIHLIVPIIGIAYFLLLVKKIKEEQISKPPILELFLLFLTYGVLIIIFLTTLVWKWSALASLGAFYLILIAPIIMLILIFKMRDEKNTSRFHKGILYGAKGYFIATPIVFILSFLLD